MAFFFHWIDVGTTDAEWLAAATWSPAYATNDEDVLNMQIDHEEGQIPSMTVQVRNPQIGLLNPTRKLWAWLSWNGNGYVEPLFFGRLVGIPTDLLAEAVTLQFTARHRNFVINKQVAAEAMKVRPYYDPVFIDVMKRDDPDAILEGYSALWHVDRVDLGVNPSDVLIGEDGNAIFLEDEIPYDSVQVNLNQVPLNAVYVSAEANWKQEFSGYIDTGTEKLKTYSGDGILAEWPRPASSLGGGWSVVSSFIKDLNKISDVLTISYSTSWNNNEKSHNTADVMSISRSRAYPNFSPNTDFTYRRITYQQVIGLLDANRTDSDGDPSPTNIPESLEYTETYVPQFHLKYSMGLRYDAERTRSERIEFTLKADTQAVLSDALLDQETDNINLPGADVGLPLVNFRNWSSIAGRYVGLGEFIFPDNPDVAGQKSIQVSVVSGVAGTTIPVFSNVAGVTTQDGTVTWSSLGSANGIYNISEDWPRQTVIPLGEIILPRVPFSLLYKDFVSPGRMQEPEVGVSVSLHQIVEVPNKGFYECTLDGTTDKKNPSWKTNGSITKDGTVEWTYIGGALPTGVDYYVCTNSGTTGEYLPRFGEGNTLVNDGGVVWTKLPASEVPVGGAPGKTPRNDYFPTDRGRQSIEYLLCLARARLRMRSRAVEITFDCRFERATKLSCRMNATLYDRRLPGGVATGKIISYSLMADGDKGALVGRVKIGCAVGNGSGLSIALGDPVYATDGYVSPGYQQYDGSTAPVGDDIGYTPPASNATDVFNYPLTNDQVFPNGGFETRGSLSAQKSAINKALDKEWVAANLAPTSITSAEKSLEAQQLAMQAAANSVQIKLQENPIWIELEIKPVAGISYSNFYSIDTTELPVPKMIDLEAASNATPPSVGSNIVKASAAFVGVGNVNYSGTQPWRNASASIGGSGGLTVYAGVVRGTNPVKLSGSGASASKATYEAYASFDPFDGAGTLANVKANRVSSPLATFSGQGGVVAKAAFSYPIVPTSFNGVGTITRAYARVINATNPASVAGEGTLRAAATVRIGKAAGFTGDAALVADAAQRHRGSARFGGLGAMSNPRILGEAALTGEGAMLGSDTNLASALFSGSGSFASEVSVEMPAQADLSGEGIFTAYADGGAIDWDASADLSGGGTLSAIPAPLESGASLGGAGSMVAVATPAGARYWRVYVNTTDSGNYPTMHLLEFYESVYGGNVATGGTALEGTHFGGSVAANAFDDELYSNAWTAAGATPDWLGYDFGAGNEKAIVSIGIIGSSAGYETRSPKSFDVQYSSNGTSWTTAWSVTNAGTWAANEFKTFTDPDAVIPDFTESPWGSHDNWRINTLYSSDINYHVIAEIGMSATVDGSTQTSGGTATASSVFGTGFEADKAFDGNAATCWHSSAVGGGTRIAYEFASAVEVGKVSMQARNDAFGSRTPRNFVIQFADSSTGPWRTTFQRRDETGWTTSEIRTYLDPNYKQTAAAAMAGAGSLTTILGLSPASAGFNGNGTIAASTEQLLGARGDFSGEGTIFSSTEQTMQAVASLAGDGSMAELNTIYGAAPFNGVGSFTTEADTADPNFASVVALVGMAGENGSTVFKDDSSYARTVTPNGNAQVSSGQTLFGNNTGTFDATDDYLSIAHSTDLAVSNTTDKTIEIWFRMTTGGRINTLVNKRPAASAHEFSFVVDGNDKLAFYAYASGSAVLAITGTTTVSTNTWYHAAAVRTTGGVWKIYLDGVQEATGTQSGTPSAGGTALLIGRDGSNTARDFAGQLSEMRYTNFARYTAAFNPPPTTFPRDWTYAKAKFGGSGTMVAQAVNPADLSDRLLEDNASFRLLEDGTSKRLLE